MESNMGPEKSRSLIVLGPILLLILGIVSTGCVTTQESVTTQQTLFALQEQNQKLDDRVKSLERQVQGGKSGPAAGPQSLADLSSRIETMQVELGTLKGQVEEQARRLDQMAGVPGAAAGSASNTTTTVVTRQPTQAATTTPTLSFPEDPEKAQYTKALKLYEKGDYPGTRKEFEKFLKEFPTSNLADNAQFWIGDSYYAQQRYKEAINAYQLVQDNYPNGNKVPAAILQQANAWSKMGDNTAARILYQRVTERYPNTPEAASAANKLKQIP